MKRRGLIFLSLLLAAGFVFGQYEDLAEKAKKYREEFDHVVLEEIVDVRVRESGMNIRDEKHVIQVLTDDGARRHHTVSFFFDPLTSHLKVTGASVVREGKMRPIPLDQVRVYPQPARAIYWPNTRVSIPFGLLEPGDIIVYRFEKRGFSYALLSEEVDDSRFTPPMEGHFYDIVDFQSFTPILYKKYTVEMPKSRPIQYRYYNGEVHPYTEFTAYGMKYVFTKRDIEPLNREPHMVSRSDVGQKLLISTTVSWRDKSEWFYGVNEHVSFNITPDIQKKVDDLIAGCRTDEEKIDTLNHWVAHYVRYSGITMGEGEGFTLHPAEMIFTDRTGVCKDKAGLLITFLRAAGFDAYPAMTMAGARIEKFPADHFNHCVVALRLQDGTFRMLDPTWVPWVREQWSSAEQEQQYLIGYKEGQDLMTTPYSPSENHYYKVDSTCSVSASGELKARIRIDYEGQVDSRLRRYLRRDHDLEARAFFRQWVFSAYPGAAIDRIQYNDPWDLSKPMSVLLEFRVPGYALVGKSKLMLKSPAVFLTASDPIHREFSWDFPDENRRYGIRTSCTKQVAIRETIRFQRNPKAAGSVLPEPLSHGGTYADVDLKAGIEGRYLKITGALNLKKRVYPREAYHDLKIVIGGLQTFNKRTIRLAF
jgi:hypothetical protein